LIASWRLLARSSWRASRDDENDEQDQQAEGPAENHFMSQLDVFRLHG